MTTKFLFPEDIEVYRIGFSNVTNIGSDEKVLLRHGKRRHSVLGPDSSYTLATGESTHIFFRRQNFGITEGIIKVLDIHKRGLPWSKRESSGAKIRIKTGLDNEGIAFDVDKQGERGIPGLPGVIVNWSP